jgi:hypothetical protein
MTDKSLGSIIFTLGLIGIIAYVYWLFAPANPEWLFICPWINVRWAIVLPVLLVVVGVLFMGMWIGWTMVVTPPPIIKEVEEIEEDT